MPESQPIPMKDLGDYIDYEEAEKVLATADNTRDKILIGLLWCCGLRASELGTIQWKNIDFDDNAIIVIGKGKKAGRVPVEPRLMEWIKEFNMLYYNPDGYLLEGNSGKGIGRSMIWRLVDKYSKKSGVLVTKSNRKLHPHSFRHSLAIWMVKMGVPIPKIQQILRHSSLNATTYYLQFSTKELSEDYLNAWKKARESSQTE